MASRYGVWSMLRAGPALVWRQGDGSAWRVADGKRVKPSGALPHREGSPWRVVGSRNHLSRETLDYLARFGDIERGEIEAGLHGQLSQVLHHCRRGAELYPRLTTCEWDTAAAQAVLKGPVGL